MTFFSFFFCGKSGKVSYSTSFRSSKTALQQSHKQLKKFFKKQTKVSRSPEIKNVFKKKSLLHPQSAVELMDPLQKARKPAFFFINLGSWIMLDKLCEPSTSGVDKKCFVDYIQLSISLNFHLCVTGPFKMSSVCWCRLQVVISGRWQVNMNLENLGSNENSAATMTMQLTALGRLPSLEA